MSGQIKRTPAGIPTGGQFASHGRADSNVSLHSVEVRERAESIEPGDLVMMESNSDRGPMRHAFMSSRGFRAAWKAADRPSELAVVSVETSTFDPHSDVTVVFDIGGALVPLDFHQDARLLTRKSNG